MTTAERQQAAVVDRDDSASVEVEEATDFAPTLDYLEAAAARIEMTPHRFEEFLGPTEEAASEAPYSLGEGPQG